MLQGKLMHIAYNKDRLNKQLKTTNLSPKCSFKDELSSFKLAERSERSGFGSRFLCSMTKFAAGLIRWSVNWASTLIVLKNKRNVKVPHRGLFVQQREDLLAVLNGPASSVSQFLLFESDIPQDLPIQYLEEERILCWIGSLYVEQINRISN